MYPFNAGGGGDGGWFRGVPWGGFRNWFEGGGAPGGGGGGGGCFLGEGALCVVVDVDATVEVEEGVASSSSGSGIPKSMLRCSFLSLDTSTSSDFFSASSPVVFFLTLSPSSAAATAATARTRRLNAPSESFMAVAAKAHLQRRMEETNS